MRTSAAPASRLRVDLDLISAQQVLQTLTRVSDHPQLLVDCANLRCLRTLGVSHVASELLVLRRGGAPIWLRGADPVLRRCLGLLQIEQLFLLAD